MMYPLTCRLPSHPSEERARTRAVLSAWTTPGRTCARRTPWRRCSSPRGASGRRSLRTPRLPSRVWVRPSAGGSWSPACAPSSRRCPSRGGSPPPCGTWRPCCTGASWVSSRTATSCSTASPRCSRATSGAPPAPSATSSAGSSRGAPTRCTRAAPPPAATPRPPSSPSRGRPTAPASSATRSPRTAPTGSSSASRCSGATGRWPRRCGTSRAGRALGAKSCCGRGSAFACFRRSSASPCARSRS
mmetsp:Transcript_33288/g.89095  ORF Transcript_33288/g.89095 Transcript_33288/m.89095 type:complete len:245 (-) Transcript_33288:701-1435(-)